MNENSRDNHKKALPACCSQCRKKPCEELYWKDALVLPDYFGVPLDCPLRMSNEMQIEETLNRMNFHDLTRMSGEVWIKHDFGARTVNTGNPKADEINHILSHFRRNMCTVLGKRAAPDFKPWTMFGMWANGGGSVPYFRKEDGMV
jgi:hypothetical protein